MKQLLNRLLCAMFRHRRGKRISPMHVRCPRCGAEWERKEKAKA